MSGIFGHTMYAILASKAAEERKLPIWPIVNRHFSSYLAGSYLGSDVQVVPAAVIKESGEEIGFCAARVGDEARGKPYVPWRLEFDGREHTPMELYLQFYGRAHLLFGWRKEEEDKTIEWDQLPSYLAAVAGDALELFGPGHRQLAYVLGWITHLVGDSLIKSVQPGVTLSLLNGTYTPQNRPIQDLVTFHQIGRKELNLDWAALLADAVDTPVEPIQPHFMRVGQPVGQLSWYVPDGWKPELRPLLLELLAVNRHYQRIRNGRLLEEIALTDGPDGPQCNPDLSKKTGGLSYTEMVKLADEANFRHALWQIAEAITDLFEQIIEEQPLLQDLPMDNGPTWAELRKKWRKE
jgi:hypothetical protein